MKKFLLVLLFITSTTSYSQIPTGYYDTATGTGYTLKTQLYNIIQGHTDNGYSGLWTTYETSDRDIYYENDNTILDMYSEDPSGADPYNFTYSTSQCGSYAIEGDCYNREHIIPQSVFNENSPMVSDAHFIVPTDGKVNGFRSNYPHGTVGTQASSSPSQNGSKWGDSSISGYTGTVFEPIDEFKGDIARMYFYFATRYENVLTTWGVSYDMFNGTTDQVFAEPFLTLLMTWHNNDPVSAREIGRNTEIYARQNNRNPFIDHPEYVAQIWSTTADTEAPTAPTNLIASNITNTTVDLNWTASTDNVGVTSYDIFVDDLGGGGPILFATSTTTSKTLTGLTIDTSYALTVYAKDAFGNTSTVSNTENITTTNIIDTTDPSIPTVLVVSNETSTTIDLTWTASTDDQAVKEYDVYIDGSYSATTISTTFTASGLTPSTTYSFSVLARDTSDNVSLLSIAVDGTTTAASSFCGSETFTNSNATSSYADSSFTGDNSVTWTYTESRDEENYSITGIGLMLRNTSSTLISSTVSNGIEEFTCNLLKGFTGSGNRQVALYVNGIFKGNSIAWDNTDVQTFTVSGINISGDVIVEIRNATGKQVVIDDISWTCFASSDTEVPSTISDLTSSNITSNSADLSWTVATDNVGVTSYEIFKDGVFLASSATNSYAVAGLSGSTSYDFTVFAKDAVGNTSLVSNTETFTTSAGSSTASELFISEYIEGSSFNKAIEIANFTGATVDLSVYSIKKETNGSGAWETALNLSGNLINGEVFIVANSSAIQAILDEADLTIGENTTPTNFNGNDPIGLFKNDVLIDIVGVFNNGTANFAKDVTLRRKPTISSPNTTFDKIGEWDEYSQDNIDDLGSHTLSALSVQKFVKNLFTVYPNPTKTKSVTIAIKNNESINAVQFYNLLGQLIVDLKNSGEFQNKIEVKNIPSGFYIIKVFNDKTYSTKRLIVE